MKADTKGAFEQPKKDEAKEKVDTKTEIMKIELEIQRQYAVKAAYAVMITQSDQVIQELLFARMKLQAAEQGLDVGLLEPVAPSQS